MVKNRRANAVLFGFDFQRNAAIILMLERIKELRSVRLEGNEEDIELTLENGKKILAQAKAVEKSSSDFSHVRENLKKALISLSEGAQRVDAQELIFITNSPNPFNDEASRSVFGGLPTHRSFSSLPPSAQVTVQKYLGNIEHPLDSEKFTVQVFPFETDNEAERYKAVTQAMNDFIGSLNVNVSYGLGKWLLQVWHDEIFINGAKKDVSIQLRKKDIIWPILVYETDINRCDDDFLNQFDVVFMTKLFVFTAVLLIPVVNVSNFSQRFCMTTHNFSAQKSRRKNAKSLLIVAGRITNQNLLLVALMKKHWKRLQRSFCTM